MAVIFRGKSVAGGVHAGEILLFPEAPIRILTLKTKYVEAEVTYFRSVLSAAKQQLEALYDIAAVRYAEQAADIFDAQLSILQDECSLTDSIEEQIRKEHWNAAKAIEQQFDEFIRLLKSREDGPFPTRAAVANELKLQLLRLALGIHQERVYPEEDAILVMQNVTTADLIHMDKSNIVGIAVCTQTVAGHVAAIGKSREIPVVAGVRGCNGSIPNKGYGIIDGDQGILIASLTPDEVREYLNRPDGRRKYLDRPEESLIRTEKEKDIS
ncbi:phosphoenolpyruvate-utilizing N-terminal domain-containing protein [Diplocloster agilis]|uniref:Phosphoenolpyruvate-protein phosphotransferase n=1 Tax=Diplocloster agilis TaxID=2850323 RepID=A0A949NCM2_9FIRM|nr:MULTISPECIES: phosphoenolpyruvate-utilizing N-terminal domain-containing protein [Lachnospiraceae]MBU9735031.1 hypothetical protein [Diplocloster agilis]MBU9742443.1 hypothetical protein [Diplocloster agilis]MCU6733326.1 PEP-utilizing enzyme [Suonthocola fibrivorans]SCI87328.1 Phosphoenolpyruvate-protein phosphotransferase [uncultured Clostridium sp.]